MNTPEKSRTERVFYKQTMPNINFKKWHATPIPIQALSELVSPFPYHMSIFSSLPYTSHLSQSHYVQFIIFVLTHTLSKQTLFNLICSLAGIRRGFRLVLDLVIIQGCFYGVFCQHGTMKLDRRQGKFFCDVCILDF